MSRIAIGSMFRNSSSYLQRYTEQLANLSGKLAGRGHSVHFVLVEGDSSDDTLEVLNQRMRFLYEFVKMKAGNSRLTIIKREHGGQVYGSIEHEQRWRNISFVCDGLLEEITQEDDYLIYVESDLIWDAKALVHLLDDLRQNEHIDAVAPFSIHKPTDLFYDTWGHRKNGVRFQQQFPYHAEVTSDLTQIDSAGSCIVMRGIVARTCRFDPPEEGIVGFCQNMRAHGFSLYVDPCVKVYHP